MMLDPVLHLLAQIVMDPIDTKIYVCADDIGGVVPSLTIIEALEGVFRMVEQALLLELNPKKMAIIPVCCLEEGVVQTFQRYLRARVPAWCEVPILTHA
eukprot:11415839-Karenia_brevis.AAC.1